jgi:hypothetical protein
LAFTRILTSRVSFSIHQLGIQNDAAREEKLAPCAGSA